jgi:hypothetical protein
MKLRTHFEKRNFNILFIISLLISPLCDAGAMHKGISLLSTYKISNLVVVNYYFINLI